MGKPIPAEIEIGPTGDGAGYLGPDDKGGLYAAMSIVRDRLVVEFGTELGFIAMTKSEAQSFALSLLTFADRLPDEKEPSDG